MLGTFISRYKITNFKLSGCIRTSIVVAAEMLSGPLHISRYGINMHVILDRKHAAKIFR